MESSRTVDPGLESFSGLVFSRASDRKGPSVGDLDVVVVTEGDALVVSVAGEVDVATYPTLETTLDSLPVDRARRVILDTSAVSFIDVGGVRLVVGLAERTVRAGSQLVLRSPSRQIRRILQIIGRAELLDKIDDDHALDAAIVETIEQSSRHDLADTAMELLLSLLTDVPGVVGASVTTERHGRAMTVAASDTTSARMDAIQYDVGEGPCLSAMYEGVPKRSDSVASETRWPRFVASARTGGIGSVLSTPLLEDGHGIGALNAYSDVPRAFNEPAVRVLSRIAVAISRLLVAAAQPPSKQLLDDVRRALDSRAIIAQAQGALIAHGADDDSAQSALHRGAREAGRTVKEQAAAVISARGQTPASPGNREQTTPHA